MEPFSKEVFDLFQQKLKVGNRRGVHLNAIANNSRYKFDLSRLSAIFKSLPERFVLDLLTLRNLKFSFSLYDTPSTDMDHRSYNTESQGKKLLEREDNKEQKGTSNEGKDRESLLEKLSTSMDNLIFQSEAILQERGINALGFGFPILARRDLTDGQITVAPVLIWSVRIRPSSQMSTWEISRTEEDPIYINEVLINHLQNDSHITIPPIPEEMLEDGKIDKSELHKLLTELLAQLKVNQNLDFLENNYAEISPIRSKAYYEDLLPERGQALIEKAGLFSLFEVQKQNIINDYQTLKESFEPKEITLKEDFQSFSSVATDPSQQEILEGLRTQSRILIQGPPGTGKSQTLTALLVNALENQQKTLVVCEKQTALEVLYNALKEKGLEKYTILIKDSITDRKLVVDALRNTLDSNTFKNPVEPYPLSLQKEQVAEISALKNQINLHHSLLFSPILSQENWTDLAGKILEYEGTKTSIDLTSLPLTYQGEEYEGIKKMLEKAQERYTPFAPYKESYLYNAKTLIEKSISQSQHYIEEAFTSYRSQWEQILSIYQDYEKEYKRLRQEEFSAQIETLNEYINEIETLTAMLSPDADQYHRERTNSFFYRIGALFSSSKKQVLKEQKRLLWLFQEIKKISVHPNFSFLFLSDNLYSNKENILSYRGEIEKAKQNFEANVSQAFGALDVLNFFDKKYTNPTFERLLSAIDALKEQIKREHYTSFTDVGSTFFEFRDRIIALLTQHAQYQEDKNNPFLIGYEWFSFYEPLSDLHKKCIGLLESAKANHWEASFLYAYYKAFLLKKSGENPVFHPSTYDELRKKLRGFVLSQTEIIQRYWDSAQRLAVKNFETLHKDLSVANLYNKRKSEKHNRLPLRQIAQKDIDLLTSFFPIILTTPDTCCNLFQGTYFYFDYVVFDEASQLKLEDNLPAILKGKTVIIAGDEHQMPPSNYFSKIFEGNYEDEDDMEDEDDLLVKNSLLSVESLLDFAQEYKYDKHYLNFHYRSRHPFLIDFSNVAFYRGKLRPMPSLAQYTPIEFYQVGGTFHEHINEQEAEKIIDILRNIPKKSDGTYPSVGVATFNITQRNFIRKRLLSLRNDPREEAFAQKLSLLEEAGLFIKNLENIQGDERDIILLSVTYGKKKDGKFIQSFGPLNHQKGYKLLNVIITRAKEKIYVCNSIPQEFFMNYAEALAQEQSNNRRAVLYAYLAYCKAVNENNESERQKILYSLSLYGNIEKEKTSLGQLLFKEEVFLYLQEKFPSLSLSKDKPFGGYTIDIFIERDKGQPIAIECLSKEIYQNEMGYLEDIHKEQILGKVGVLYMRIHANMPIKNYLTALEKLLANT